MRYYTANQLYNLDRETAKEVLTLTNEDLSRLPHGSGTVERRRELKQIKRILYANIMRKKTRS